MRKLLFIYYMVIGEYTFFPVSFIFEKTADSLYIQYVEIRSSIVELRHQEAFYGLQKIWRHAGYSA